MLNEFNDYPKNVMPEVTNISVCSGHSGSALCPKSGIMFCTALHRDGGVDMFFK